MKKFFGDLFSQANVEDVEVKKKAPVVELSKETIVENHEIVESVVLPSERYSTFLSTDKPIYK
jgi:hypothetical protein